MRPPATPARSRHTSIISEKVTEPAGSESLEALDLTLTTIIKGRKARLQQRGGGGVRILGVW